MDIKTILGIVGGICIAGSFIPYIRDIMKSDTEPHVYTWFIWSVTHMIAALAILEGNGGVFAALSVATGGILSLTIFFMSLKRGTKNITTFDTVTLITAILAVVMWWKLDHPEWAIITIVFIDILGFVPTIRKTWHKPRSESMFAWSVYAFGNIAALFAITTYSIMTSAYIIAMIAASFVLVTIIMIRRRYSAF
jgi:hypothetical protein